MEETRFDPRRRLCPDGACIGLIGPDGRCKECGRPASGMAAVPAAADDGASERDVAVDRDDASDGDGASDGEGASGHENDGGEAAAGGFDTTRRLCDDGGCVGVVGADGVCRVCGRRAEG